jgi:pilus assembly protein CpaF
MTMMAGMDLPTRAIREQIASALELVCHLERMRDGTRKVTHITEIQGMEGDVITMTDLFVFEQTGLENGKVIGRLRPTGLRPKFMEKIEQSGIHLPASIFGVGDRNLYR